MSMFDNNDDAMDLTLIDRALNGDKRALEQLIKRHQDFIFNVSLRLFAQADDAQDATQEVLIKMVTHLHGFKRQSNFKTWLYRIAFNHFLNAPKSQLEVRFEQAPGALSGFAESDAGRPLEEEEIEEVRMLCSSAMLMCLSREQRLLYIVGEVFEADHTLGAALFDTTPANYRVKLHRAKADLLNFVSGKCGLIHPDNPCRCPKKTRLLVDRGIVSKDRLMFNRDFEQRVFEVVTARKDDVSDHIQFRMKDLFQNSPFQVRKELDEMLNDLVK